MESERTFRINTQAGSPNHLTFKSVRDVQSAKAAIKNDANYKSTLLRAVDSGEIHPYKIRPTSNYKITDLAGSDLRSDLTRFCLKKFGNETSPRITEKSKGGKQTFFMPTFNNDSLQ